MMVIMPIPCLSPLHDADHTACRKDNMHHRTAKGKPNWTGDEWPCIIRCPTIPLKGSPRLDDLYQHPEHPPVALPALLLVVVGVLDLIAYLSGR